MNILITNDDGIDSPGIAALALSIANKDSGLFQIDPVEVQVNATTAVPVCATVFF